MTEPIFKNFAGRINGKFFMPINCFPFWDINVKFPKKELSSIMRILGRDKIDKCIRKHASSKASLSAWCHEVESAEWKAPQDIKDRYSSADFLAGNRVIFNIKGIHFRLVVKVRYENELVVVEWVGTHADYSKQDF